MTARAPVLVIGVGNPSRGDDALGPLALERLAAALAPTIEAGALELLTDFQLQIEHALDVAGRARAIFVDASVRAAPPFTVTPTVARQDGTHTTHAMSPAAVLHAAASIGAPLPTEAWTLAIRGEAFELGAPLSAAAAAHLEAALPALLALGVSHNFTSS